MWDEFESVIGIKYLYAFHLNDSEKGLGSRVDRHAHIGQGKIGKDPERRARFSHRDGVQTPGGGRERSHRPGAVPGL